MPYRNIHFGFVCCLIAFLSCGSQSTKGTLAVTVNFVYGIEPFAYNVEYPYGTNGKIKFEEVRFYVSMPKVISSSGDWLSVPETYFLVSPDKNRMQWGEFLTGTYTQAGFGIGVDNSRNIQTDPQAIPATDYPDNHPLSYASDMYWGWATGYIFAKVQGRIDADGNGSYVDSVDRIFSYHPGVAGLYRTVNLPGAVIIEKGVNERYVTLDIKRLVQGVDFLQYPTAHPTNENIPEYGYARVLMDNFPLSFE